MGCLVVSSPMKQDGKLSDRDSYVMFHPADRRVPHMLIARGDLPSLFLDVSASRTVGSFRGDVVWPYVFPVLIEAVLMARSHTFFA